jgi:hypothetical protein
LGWKELTAKLHATTLEVVEPTNIFFDGLIYLYLQDRYASPFVRRRMKQLHDENPQVMHKGVRALIGNAVKCFGCEVVLASKVGGVDGDPQAQTQDSSWRHVHPSGHRNPG